MRSSTSIDISLNSKFVNVRALSILQAFRRKHTKNVLVALWLESFRCIVVNHSLLVSNLFRRSITLEKCSAFLNFLNYIILRIYRFLVVMIPSCEIVVE